MNFQSIPPVDKSKTLLDIAFRRAREKGKQKNLTGNWLQIIRKKECLKLDIIKDSINPRLEKVLGVFPETKQLPFFYVKLMELTLDFPAYKKSCGAIDWAIKRVRKLQSDYVRRIIKTKERDKIKELSKQFYGRLASVLKQIDSNLEYLESARKILRTYPDIKDMFTVCIYGFPNVGKTTLLNKLTGARAEIASYAFTTRGINSGFFTVGDQKVQVLDVPGTLAREEKMNNIELQAELVRTEVADIIIYVFDLTEQCGYSIKKQEKLLKNLKQKKKKRLLIYLSKKDLMKQDEMKQFKLKHFSEEELKEKIAKLIPEDV